MDDGKRELTSLVLYFRNPEPLGTEFKTVACSVTGALLFIEVHIGKEGIKHSKYHQYLVSTEACNKRMMEATKGVVKNSIKEGTKDCFLFDSWFASKKASKAVMEVGSEWIGMLKTNIKGFFKDNIEKLTKDWPGGSHLVLRSKPMVPGERPLTTVGYKYNLRKVLYLIVTDNAWEHICQYSLFI